MFLLSSVRMRDGGFFFVVFFLLTPPPLPQNNFPHFDFVQRIDFSEKHEKKAEGIRGVSPPRPSPTYGDVTRET